MNWWLSAQRVIRDKLQSLEARGWLELVCSDQADVSHVGGSYPCKELSIFTSLFLSLQERDIYKTDRIYTETLSLFLHIYIKGYARWLSGCCFSFLGLFPCFFKYK